MRVGIEHNPPAAASAEERDAVERAARAVGGGGDIGRPHLLPLLQAVQRERGWLSRGALVLVADRLGLPFPEVWGVATFYALLRLEPPPDVAVHVCDDVPCLLRGADALLEELRARLGPPGRFTGRAHGAPKAGDAAAAAWETVPCLGRCDGAPAAVVGGALHLRADAAAIVRVVRAGRADGGGGDGDG